jgi:hypothetical protein
MGLTRGTPPVLWDPLVVTASVASHHTALVLWAVITVAIDYAITGVAGGPAQVVVGTQLLWMSIAIQGCEAPAVCRPAGLVLGAHLPVLALWVDF